MESVTGQVEFTAIGMIWHLAKDGGGDGSPAMFATAKDEINIRTHIEF